MRTTTRDTRLAAFIAVLTVILGLLPFGAPRALAADPVVTLVGSLQYELGCADDWAPECTATRMTNDGSGTYVYDGQAHSVTTYTTEKATVIGGSLVGTRGLIGTDDVTVTLTDNVQTAPGQYLIGDAIFEGLAAAVERMRKAIARGRRQAPAP